MIESQMLSADMHVQTLGWVLLNFIWQGFLLAAVLKGLLTGMQRYSATLRYNVAVVVLFVLLAVPVISFLKPHLPQSGSQSENKQTTVVSYPVQVMPGDRQKSGVDNIAGSEEPIVEWADLLSSVQYILPWLCTLWLTGVLVAFTRTLVGLIKVMQLKRGANELAGDIDLPVITRKSGIHSSIRLLETPLVTVPSVIGWFSPVILFPEGSRFLPEQAEALIAHELAHIRRRDHLVNLFQVIIESLLFFHPAVWWVSSQVRIERESCCDDAAISACGNVKTYVRSLTEAERCRSASKWAVAASGASLLNRIRRITEMKKKPVNRFFSLSAMIFGVSLIITVASGSSLLAFVPKPFHAPVENDAQMNPKAKVGSPSLPVSGTHPVIPVQVALLEAQPEISVQTGSKQLGIPPDQTMIEVESTIIEIASSELEKFELLGKKKIYSPTELAELRDKIQSGEIEAKILSNPKVLTLDQKEAKIAMAKIAMGGKVHYMEKTGDGLYKPKAFETPIGTQLSITPTILEKRIKMDINLKVTDISGRLAVAEFPDLNIGEPTIRTKESTISIILNDGDTVVIGGMKKDNPKEDNEMIAFITAGIFRK